jgi:hypothetical protein
MLVSIIVENSNLYYYYNWQSIPPYKLCLTSGSTCSI